MKIEFYNKKLILRFNFVGKMDLLTESCIGQTKFA